MYTIFYEFTKQECETVEETLSFINYLNDYCEDMVFQGILIKHESGECLELGIGSVDNKSVFFLDAMDDNDDHQISFTPSIPQGEKIIVPMPGEGSLGCFKYNLIDFYDAITVAEHFLKNKSLPAEANYHAY